MLHKLGFCWCGTPHPTLDDIPEPDCHCPCINCSNQAHWICHG